MLRRCLASARTIFDGRIVVADDSRSPASEVGAGVHVIPLPFNSGVSVGRNAALDAVETDLVFVTDDDAVFTDASDIVAAMNLLDNQPEVDLVAFTRVDLPRRRGRRGCALPRRGRAASALRDPDRRSARRAQDAAALPRAHGVDPTGAVGRAAADGGPPRLLLTGQWNPGVGAGRDAARLSHAHALRPVHTSYREDVAADLGMLSTIRNGRALS